jgi:hypothetical protein
VRNGGWFCFRYTITFHTGITDKRKRIFNGYNAPPGKNEIDGNEWEKMEMSGKKN